MARGDFEVSTINIRDWGASTFAIFALTGMAAVATSKYFGFPTWSVVCLPIVVIGGYWLVAWNLPRLELRRDQIGDNLYYLGFLLTLSSLSVTLLEYTADSDEDYIVSNFGLALMATVVGIFGRTIASQMRKDVVGVERAMQANLAEMAVKLRGQMAASVETFASFQRQMAQVTNESSQITTASHVELTRGLVSIVDEQTSEMSKAAERNSELLNEATRSAVDQLQKVVLQQNQAMSELMERTNEGVATSVQNLNEVSGKFIGTMEGKVKDIVAELEGQKQTIAAGAFLLRQGVKEFEEVTFDPTSLRNFEHGLDTTFGNLTNRLNSFGAEISVELESLTTATAKFTESLSNLRAASDALDAQLLAKTESIEAKTEPGLGPDPDLPPQEAESFERVDGIFSDSDSATKP